MTIAACYVSSEGVVIGADSTSTIYVPTPHSTAGGSFHHFNFAQKLFEIGENATLGITMWGLGGLEGLSYRTMLARLADGFVRTPPQSVLEATEAWRDLFWREYQACFGEWVQRYRTLEAMPSRTEAESDELRSIEVFAASLEGGFCIGGRCMPDRQPAAFEFTYNFTMFDAPRPDELTQGETRFWGCPNIIERLLYGIDPQILQEIALDEKWVGTTADLSYIARRHMLAQPKSLPLRDAIDWVHSSIYTTIKAMKFSHMAPVCGGPIEIAVVTSDRPFRWVRHKNMADAIQ